MTSWQVGTQAAELTVELLLASVQLLYLSILHCSSPDASEVLIRAQLEVLLAADGGDIESLPAEKQEQFQEMRCGSTGRGSVYDSVAGGHTVKAGQLPFSRACWLLLDA